MPDSILNSYSALPGIAPSNMLLLRSADRHLDGATMRGYPHSVRSFDCNGSKD